ncbi:MAG: AAA family ATPase [Oscillospiraceae bacterium]
MQIWLNKKIYERLLDSKILIVRNGDRKALKFPYKHIVIFPEERVGKVSATPDQLKQLYGYASFDAFRPITSEGNEKRIEDLQIFTGIRKTYDHTFKSISDMECRAIFERLAPEYTVVMNETLHIRIDEKKTLVTEKDLRITGQEQEFKTFFLDEYQVGVVNDMGKGHRVILANPGAGKSVLLLSKAFKYASLYKESNVLLTCYNNNLSESYNFKRNCANFGENRNLFILTFHKLVKKIYEECLHSHCAFNIATDEEIQKCIDLVKQGKVKLRFKAIFIDEVQIFDPLYLELCYRLFEDDDDRVFLMAGDLNQAVRALSRKGDAPWERINGIHLDFTGSVRYIEKNYRNSQEIGEYMDTPHR